MVRVHRNAHHLIHSGFTPSMAFDELLEAFERRMKRGVLFAALLDDLIA
jgi:hypothetical protein